ncbi:MAG TPA: carbonic anhydrase [Jatrophihabitantaceae bacterium]|jgi:carbonic anhydrase|nr:carbonic anhydrase [Jatrophihabitantaceae bacterium]
MSATDHLVHANASFVGTYPGGRPKQPKLRLTIIECMDSRIDTFTALGLQIGDAHIIRNGGGLITDDVLRSLAISQRALGTQSVMIMHHTDCGMHGFDDTAFRAELAAESGQEPTWDVPGFTDIEGKVRESLAAVRNCGWIKHRDDVRGFVYDVQTGKITEVE